METISKDTKVNVDALKQILLQLKITRGRFKFPLTEEQTKDVLLAAYQAETEYRHRKFCYDEHTHENICNVARFLTGENEKFGMIFMGMSGNGKTTMLYALRNAINYLNGLNLFEDSSQVGLQVIDAKEIATIQKNVESFRTLKNRPMLAIEDMGREPTEVREFGNVLNPVIDLVEYRYDEQLFTIVSTNLNPKEVKQKYGERVADRFNEMLKPIIFKNKSYRL